MIFSIPQAIPGIGPVSTSSSITSNIKKKMNFKEKIKSKKKKIIKIWSCKHRDLQTNV